MRAFCWFFGLILLGIAAIGLLSYPAWQLVSPHFNFAFHRVGTRIGMLVVLCGFFYIARRLRLGDRVSLGYGLPRAAFFREAGVGLLLGLGLMLPIVAAMLALDLRVLKSDVVLDTATVSRLIVRGFGSGLTVALIEETFLRGAMWSGIARESGPRLAMLLTALVYAATHFIGRFHIAAADVGPDSGMVLLAGTFHDFAAPLAIADAFLCLFAVGLLLGLVRQLTGNIAACLGLHAGWVCVITFVRETSTRDPAQPLSWLLSAFDGFVGWMVLAWTAVIGLALYRFYRHRNGHRNGHRSVSPRPAG